MKTLRRAFEAVRSFALGYPETHEDLPWGESAIKVKGKTFVFMRCDESGFAMSMKLPERHQFALEYPFTRSTGYGLGKSGWVTATFTAKDKPPLDILGAWVDESYRAVAPKKLLVSLAPAADKRPSKAKRLR